MKEIDNSCAGFQNIKRSFFEINTKAFKFLDDCFNAKATKPASRIILNPDPKLIKASNIYRNVDGWQRDYVYYGITPTTPTGPFSYDFKETITQFSMAGDPMTAYNKIADQTGDPRLHLSTNTSQISGWTGGNFEFKVTVLFNAKNGLGSVYETYFPALPTDLFNVTFTRKNVGFSIYYSPVVTQLKAMPLNLSLFNWDLNQYASTIKINIAEVDVSETITQTQTVTAKFASNFDISGTVLKKIGLKFGASLEQTTTNTFSTNYTVGNDELGPVIVNFADRVIVGSMPLFLGQNGWVTQDYGTAYYNLSIEPKRVQ